MGIKIITKKKIFSNLLLTLVLKFETNKGGDILQSRIWETISKTVKDVIKGKSKRDWFWLKTCIIPSTIWYTEIDDMEEMKEEKKDNKEKNKKLLYYKLLGFVQAESQNQLNKLQNDLKAEQQKNE